MRTALIIRVISLDSGNGTKEYSRPSQQKLWAMTDNRKKLDARGRRTLEKLAPDTQVELFIRLEADPNPEQIQTLKELGCHLGLGGGNVLTARVNASNLARLTELPFISSLQLSREVFDEDA